MILKRCGKATSATIAMEKDTHRHPRSNESGKIEIILCSLLKEHNVLWKNLRSCRELRNTRVNPSFFNRYLNSYFRPIQSLDNLSWTIYDRRPIGCYGAWEPSDKTAGTEITTRTSSFVHLSIMANGQSINFPWNIVYIISQRGCPQRENQTEQIRSPSASCLTWDINAPEKTISEKYLRLSEKLLFVG